MPLASLSYCLALLFLWPTTIATQGPADSVVGGGGSVNAAVVEGACPLEKWSLDERQNRSQVVFTGVIESCQTSDSIDGDDQEVHCQRNLAQPADTADPNLALNVRIKKVVKGLDRVWEGRLVQVEGLKDPRICPSRVRLRDTRIFLASYVRQPSADDETATPVDPTDTLHYDHRHVDSPAVIRLRLNSSLMAVSLRHLQQLRAFTKGSFSSFIIFHGSVLDTGDWISLAFQIPINWIARVKKKNNKHTSRTLRSSGDTISLSRIRQLSGRSPSSDVESFIRRWQWQSCLASSLSPKLCCDGFESRNRSLIIESLVWEKKEKEKSLESCWLDRLQREPSPWTSICIAADKSCLFGWRTSGKDWNIEKSLESAAAAGSRR